ncbi:HlyD family secretion protein [Thalassospira alkalitolerans]|uniref:Hemolysin secretion protein D n=1 Tax=Thalassospira alkalitolerans TaxID=1293890 RepID=A0A1Y2LCY7_9PROT|nr:HlyD family efflux transporter periplasmic adaptor subunit [Thalassospira alkalitolerans]OSQ47901.1 hemolysin secretion protein D [Thalassospira alkalitolerans]
MSNLRAPLVILVAALAVASGGYYYWQQNQDTLPDYITSGNGRIEAEEVHVATKYAGRVAQVDVEEGDFVTKGQVLARMDTAELEATQAKARADVAQAYQKVAQAKAEIVQRESQLKFAQSQLERANTLVKNNNISREAVDQRRSERDIAESALVASKAGLTAAERGVEAADAEVSRLQIQIDDSALTAPRSGRVQYRLAEPGEVLASGGRVVTLIDLTDVYMTIFLPTNAAGATFVGNEARIVLDAAPEFVIPASVSFVSADAQFTPREVETRSEREKLMFRAKIRIDHKLLTQHIEKVKTGLPGVAYVMQGGSTQWPESLSVALPPEASK